jgi:Putative adhesin
MRLSSFFIFIFILAAFPAAAAAQTAPKAAGVGEDFDLERVANAEPGVAVTLCLTSGDVVVRGWDRREVRARASGAGSLRLQTDAGQAARRVEVQVAHDRDSTPGPGDCGMADSIELSVPRDAVLTVQVNEGHIELSGVAEARVRTMSGDVNVRGVSRLVEVSCMSGDISLSDSTGRVQLRTVSGDVEANNLRTTQADDELVAASTSGDITLEGVTHSRVKGHTTSGNVLLSGALARGGNYELRTTSGDVTLALPADASFRVNARVIASGEIITDFPVKMSGGPMPPDTPGPPGAPAPPPPTGVVVGNPGVPGTPTVQGAPGSQRTPRAPRPPHGPKPGAQPGGDEGFMPARLVGTVGTGDAQVSMSSFSGTLHLKKQ